MLPWADQTTRPLGPDAPHGPAALLPVAAVPAAVLRLFAAARRRQTRPRCRPHNACSGSRARWTLRTTRTCRCRAPSSCLRGTIDAGLARAAGRAGTAEPQCSRAMLCSQLPAGGSFCFWLPPFCLYTTPASCPLRTATHCLSCYVRPSVLLAVPCTTQHTLQPCQHLNQ